jgi:tRNA(Ile)-lysidine synthase
VLRTRAAVRASLRDLPAGSTVYAAVSGGADSLALAAALAYVGPRLRLVTGAVTVDHALQSGSAQVAAAVAATCRELGLSAAVIRRVEVGTAGGPEAAARAARYAALETVDADVVLLGHTLDDQAETVLMRLARGSGARSLAGMAARAGRYRRPFLEVRRADTAAACATLGLTPWADPHNDDRRFARVRVRHDVLPALEAALGPGVIEALARSADLLRDDADALDEWAAKAAVDGLDVDALLGMPSAVRTRVLRRAAVQAGAPPGQLAARHVAAMDRLVVAWHGQGPVHLPGGLVAERRCGRLHLR